MKKNLALACAMSLMVSSLAGCGNAQESAEKSQTAAPAAQTTAAAVKETNAAAPAETEPAVVETKQELPISDGSLTLKVAYPVSARVEDINTNVLTNYIEEKTGINLEFIELNSSDAASQVNALMNGGNLPDIVLGYNFPYDVLCSYADAGLIQPLDEWIDEWGYNLKNTIMQDPVLGGESLMAYVSYDDHVWAMPSGGALVTQVYQGDLMQIQTRYLDELGMEKPDTLDELRAYLEAVKEKYPNVIPMTAYYDNNHIFNNISQAYQFTDYETFLKANDGQIEFIGNNELFKEALEYTAGMVADGLIDPAAWTQDMNTLSTRAAQQEYGLALTGCGSKISSVLDMAGDEYCDLAHIGVLEGPHGYKAVQYRPSVAAINRAMVITSACQYPEEAFRLFDFFLSDEFAVQARIGTEGEQWEVAKEGVVARGGGQAKYSLLTAQEWTQPTTNVIWRDTSFIHTSFMNDLDAGVSSGAEDDKATIRSKRDLELLRELETMNSGEGVPPLIMPVDEMTEYNELQTLILDNVTSNIANFVLGNRSLDEWDKYCAELESMGVERYVELAQEAYDNLYK